MYGGRGGIAEQVEEALTGRLLLDAQAHRPVIKEQPGIQVIGQVHQQAHIALTHLEELALAALPFVLLLAGLALAALDHHSLLGNAQGLRNRRQGVEQARLAFAGSIDLGAAYSWT